MKNLFNCYLILNIIKIKASCELTSNRCIWHIRWNGILIYPFILLWRRVLQSVRFTGLWIDNQHWGEEWGLFCFGFFKQSRKIPLGLLDLRLNEKLTFISLIPKPQWKSQTLHICPYFTWFNTYSQSNLLSWAWQKRWSLPLPSQPHCDLALGAQVWWWLLLKYRLLSLQPKKRLSIIIPASNFKGTTPPSSILQPSFLENPGKYIVPDTCNKSDRGLLNISLACCSLGFLLRQKYLNST